MTNTPQADNISSMKTEQVQLRMSGATKRIMTDVAYERGQNITTLILLALAQQDPRLKAAIERERKGE